MSPTSKRLRLTPQHRNLGIILILGLALGTIAVKIIWYILPDSYSEVQLSGIVKNTHGDPIHEAEITFMDQMGVEQKAETDETGRFSFLVNYPTRFEGEKLLTARKESYQILSLPVSFPIEEGKREFEFSLGFVGGSESLIKELERKVSIVVQELSTQESILNRKYEILLEQANPNLEQRRILRDYELGLKTFQNQTQYLQDDLELFKLRELSLERMYLSIEETQKNQHALFEKLSQYSFE